MCVCVCACVRLVMHMSTIGQSATHAEVNNPNQSQLLMTQGATVSVMLLVPRDVASFSRGPCGGRSWGGRGGASNRKRCDFTRKKVIWGLLLYLVLFVVTMSNIKLAGSNEIGLCQSLITRWTPLIHHVQVCLLAAPLRPCDVS